MKRALILLGAVILTILSGCGDSEDRYQPIIDTSSADSETSSLSSGTVKEEFIPGKLTYTNLNSENSVNEVKEILTGANIPSKSIDTVFEWVADFNGAMKSCPAFTLAGDFMSIEKNTVDYGDYYLMSNEWYKNSKKDYCDILCRIAAFELNRENIRLKIKSPRKILTVGTKTIHGYYPTEKLSSARKLPKRINHIALTRF